jgi:type II secretion system protein G
MKKNQKGFTLIELLVVIAIIGLLASVAMVSLTKARAKARDVKRIADIEQFTKALELYYNTNGQYPASGGAASPGASRSTSNDASWTTLETAMSPFMAKLPKDPLNTNTGWANTANTYTYSYYSLGGGCPQQWYMIVYRIDDANLRTSPGMTTCNGTVYEYGGPNVITVGQRAK